MTNNLPVEQRCLAFIAKAKRIHGDKYSYDRINYVGSQVKVELVCHRHGSFWIRPGNHVNGQRNGCRLCANDIISKRLGFTQEEFLARCIAKHGDRYDYSLVRYDSRSTSPITVVCHIHGPFDIAPHHHSLDGHGCLQCARILRADLTRISRKDFISRARKMHGPKTYDYAAIDYRGMAKQITVQCATHGPFSLIAYQFTDRRGCPDCAREHAGFVRRKDTATFLKEAKAVHGDRYDYSRTVYVHTFHPVDIICSEHGVFTTKPTHHLKGLGCPNCAKESLTGFMRDRFVRGCERQKKNGILYLIRATGYKEAFLKLGITGRSPKKRFAGLPYKYMVLKTIGGEPGYIWDMEQRLHELCHDYTYVPSLPFTGATECYDIRYQQAILDLLDEHTGYVPEPERQLGFHVAIAEARPKPPTKA